MPLRNRTTNLLQSGVETQALVTKMVTMQFDAGLTIAARMPLLAKAAMGDRRGQAEANRAVTEKVSAVMESGAAAAHAATRFWLDLMLTPLAQPDLTATMTKTALATLEPFSRRASANASRLSRRRR